MIYNCQYIHICLKPGFSYDFNKRKGETREHYFNAEILLEGLSQLFRKLDPEHVGKRTQTRDRKANTFVLFLRLFDIFIRSRAPRCRQEPSFRSEDATRKTVGLLDRGRGGGQGRGGGAWPCGRGVAALGDGVPVRAGSVGGAPLGGRDHELGAEFLLAASPGTSAILRMPLASLEGAAAARARPASGERLVGSFPAVCQGGFGSWGWSCGGMGGPRAGATPGLGYSPRCLGGRQAGQADTPGPWDQFLVVSVVMFPRGCQGHFLPTPHYGSTFFTSLPQVPAVCSA